MTDLTDRMRRWADPRDSVEAADLIDAIDGLHEKHMVTMTGLGSVELPYCTCGDRWPCTTHLLIHPPDGE